MAGRGKRYKDTDTPPLFGPTSIWRPPALSSLPSWDGARRVGIDIETKDLTLTKGGPTGRGLGPGVRRDNAFVAGISFAIEDGPKHYLPVRHRGGDNLPIEGVMNYLKAQARTYKGAICGANLGYDLDYLAEEGVTFWNNDLRDVQVAEPLINENQLSYSLNNIAIKHGFAGKNEAVLKDAALAWQINPKADLWKLPARFVGAYAEDDADLPLKVLRRQERIIEAERLEAIYDLERRVQPIIIQMRRHGVLIDFDHLDRVEQWTIEQEMIMLDEIFRLTNIRIPLDKINKKDLTAAVLDVAGLPYDYTPTGQPKIDTELLLPLAKTNKVASAIIHAKYLNKLRNTFVRSIRNHETNGRIHTTFNQLKRQEEGSEETLGAGPGRMSCVPKNGSEILTRDGWKKWNELVVGQEVMGYNTIKRTYEWTSLKAVHDTGKAPVGLIKTTRGHGAPGPKSLPSGFYCTAEHKWVIDHPDICGLQQANSPKKGLRNLILPMKKIPSVLDTDSVLSPTQAFLWGWYLTDGWLRNNGKAMCVAVVKKSSVSQLTKYLQTHLPDWAYSHRVYKKKLTPKDHLRNVHYFYIKTAYFNALHNKVKDLTPEQLILNLSEKAREHMLTAMLEGDGSRRRGENRFDRFGAEEHHPKRTWEYFCMLSTTQGIPYSVSRTVTKAGTDFLNFGLLQTTLRDDPNSKWRPSHVEDTWCPETGLGTWVMRQGTRICVTGNSSNPNLQQQPGRLPEWWTLDMPVHIFWRKIYLPDEGGQWAALDYSGQEPKLFVHFASLCNCPGAAAAVQKLKAGYDFHDSTTEMAFDVVKSATDPSHFKNLRTQAKIIFLGLVYGMGGGKLCRKLCFPVELVEIYGQMREVAGDEGKAFLKKFHTNVPFLAAIKEQVEAVAWNRRYIRTLLDRHIHYEKGASNERKALNNLIQGSAADQVKLAMVLIYEAGYKLQLQVHDECDTTIGSIKEAEAMAEIMEHCVELVVPTKVDVETGQSWGHSMEKKTA